MDARDNELTVECYNCGKRFPVAAISDQDELEQAKALRKDGGGTLRVARWCPWCQEDNMVPVTIEYVGQEIVFRDAGRVLCALAPEPDERNKR